MRRSATSAVITALILLIVGLIPATTRAQGWPGRRDRPAAVRLEVTPRNTAVYVDGQYAGIVDDFDGLFQRLRVVPGRHEIVLYLEGYRTIRQTLDLRAGADYKVRQTMVKLAAGQSSEPPPAAARPAEGPAPPPPPPPYEPRRPGRRPPVEREPGEMAGYGVLAIRVQPAGAEVIIDGDRWQSPEGEQPLLVHLAEGTHRVEVRKEGYSPFSTDVRIRQGERSPLNVSLSERR